jgi:hypothetical protein
MIRASHRQWIDRLTGVGMVGLWKSNYRFVSMAFLAPPANMCGYYEDVWIELGLHAPWS